MGRKGRNRGRARKEGRQGEVVSLARLSKVCSARLREEIGRCQLSCKLRELLAPIQR